MKLKQIHNIFARYFGLKNKPSTGLNEKQINFPVQSIFGIRKYKFNSILKFEDTGKSTER